jgi:selenocysteine lyase/cysteine desulfurase
MTVDAMSSARFRELFPALRRWAWFDTPGSPPAARPVTERLRDVLADWESGDFDWRDWDAAPETARDAFAAFARVDPADVAVLGSVAEGMSTIARALPPGSVVVADDEYRSVLFPLLALDPGRNPVIRVRGRDGGSADDDDLVATLRDDTVLLAVGDTLTSTGRRVDLARLRRETAARGAAIAADLSQSLGVLDHDLAALGLDYVLVHGYKWLLCPRGTAWLIASGPARDALAPLLPSWKSTASPYGYFGGGLELPSDASRLDTSPAWFSWVGAVAALALRERLDPAQVEAHCIGLATRFLTGMEALGYAPVSAPGASHIAVVDVGDDRDRLAAALAAADVKATLLGTRLRIGAHYFNTEDDVDRLLAAVAGEETS